MKGKLFAWILLCVTALALIIAGGECEVASPSPGAGTVVPPLEATATPTAEAFEQITPTPTAVLEPTAGPTTAPEPAATPEPTSAPTVAAPVLEPTAVAPTATPTDEESLQQFVLCSRLVANKQMRWGQAPGTIYSDNPNVWGYIEAGDYIQVLTPRPTGEGVIRVKVDPHDGREVGRSDGQVWIDWAGLELFRLDLVAFTCED